MPRETPPGGPRDDGRLGGPYERGPKDVGPGGDVLRPAITPLGGFQGPSRPAEGGEPGARYALRFEMMAPIALGSTARVDLCRSLGPAHPGAAPQSPGATAGQLLAVKRPLPELVGDENVGKRFLDEVWMTASLRHPNVVGVVGWGQDEVGPYLAVELVQGVSLARLMKSVFETGEQFSERLVVYVGACVARGLAAAHELRSERGTPLQLVHRDLTAANVLLSFQGEVRVADFGLAKAKDRLTVTTSELPTRSLSHVAPEELAQLPSDHRSDLFSFGVMLFELLTGRPPFKGKDDLATLEAIMRHTPPDPLDLRPKMDRTLSALVLRCLEKRPEHRYQSAREIVHELDRWLDAHGYRHDNHEVLARFVRRNSMRQMRWFERVIAGEPAPAPNPQAPPKLSLYDPAADGPVPATTSTSDSGRRTDEPTLVDRPRPKAPTARRSRSTESFAALQRTRRLSDGPGVDLPDFADPETDDEVPTVAIRMDRSTREALRDGKLKELPRTSPVPPRPETRGPLGTETMNRIGRSPAGWTESKEVRQSEAELNDTTNAFFAGRSPSPPKEPVVRVVEREIERLRQLAGERHEAARAAREKARLAVLEAERAEAQARIVERAMGGVRQAHDAAVRGQSDEAERRLDEALELLSTQRRR